MSRSSKLQADSSTTAPVRTESDDCLIGAYYFAGWWPELPNKYVVAGRDWRSEFPERIPTLGQYNEQPTMDREIAAAADHGIDFFQILWYPQYGEKKHEPHQDRLNVAVAQFMTSPVAHRMNFTIEYVNHAPFLIESEADWADACRYCSDAMKHPSYLRVDGRAVFKIHSVHHFLEQNGRDVNRVKARIQKFRHMSRESGAGEPLIAGGLAPGSPHTGEVVEPYDFLMTYMDVPKRPQRDSPYPYELLLEHAANHWHHYTSSGNLLYVPYLPAGWDPRPWKDPRPSFALPDQAQWLAGLRRMNNALRRNPKLGIPRADGTRQKAFIIYAWNEYAEGGFIAPSAGYGKMKLDCIREVFPR
jgi:hypothetical protein